MLTQSCLAFFACRLEQMVRPVIGHPVPQQDRFVQGQIDHFADLRVLLRL